MYSTEQKRQILKLARQAVASALARQQATVPDDIAPALLEPRGCFVTLHNTSGHLRGCIGTFDANRRLADAIIEMGGAATRDPRFVDQPVTLREMDHLVIEVSVLTPMQPLADPLAMRIGVDGIYVRDPDSRRSGCFLPQVAPEQNWDAADMFSYCCTHKMGLPHDAWREPTKLQFFTFQAIVISEISPGQLDE